MAHTHFRYMKGLRPEQRGPQKAQSVPEKLAPRRLVSYCCPKGHNFDVAFAADTESPATWDCPRHGVEAKHPGAPQPKKSEKPSRTHWDMLLERRTIPQLQELLDERLEALRVDRSLAISPGE